VDLDLLIYGRAIVVWVATLYRAPLIVRGARDPALGAYSLSLLSFALAVSVLLPWTVALGDRLSGIPTLTAGVGNALALVAVWSIHRFLHRLNFPDARHRLMVRRRARWLVATLILVGALFLAGKLQGQDAFMAATLGNAPFVLRLIVLAYFGMTVVDIARLAWRYAAMTDRPALALGLRMITWGTLVGVLVIVHELAQVSARYFGFEYPSGFDRQVVREVLITLAGVPWAIGITMPAWGPQLGIPGLYRWFARYNAYRQLYPLWRSLADALPTIALDPPRSIVADALRVRDLGYLLCRRVIEIRDARLLLRPYLEPRIGVLAHDAAQAASVPAADIPALVEATRLAAALQARARGDAPRPIAEADDATPGAEDIDGEAAFLCRVARYYARSPLLTWLGGDRDGSLGRDLLDATDVHERVLGHVVPSA